MRFLGAVLLFLLLQSCSTNVYRPQNTSRFNDALAGAYMDKASDFSCSGMSGWNSLRMQDKAYEAAAGYHVLPYTATADLVGSESFADQINSKRDTFVNLIEEYPIDTKIDNPELTALTQAALDCWIIGNSYDIYTSFNKGICKREFFNGLNQLLNITRNHMEFRDFSEDVNSIYFKFDKHSLTEDSVYRLNSMIAEISKVENATLMIYGYTDRVGSPSYNNYLAQQRIDSVKKYLIDSGVITRNNICIKEVIQGEYDPVISMSQTVNNNPHSRRVDLFIMKY